MPAISPSCRIRRGSMPHCWIFSAIGNNPHNSSLRRHCERSEAIHLSLCRTMDCFASLAMTGKGRRTQACVGNPPMKIPTLPFTVTDWSAVPATRHAGVTGEARWHTLDIGDLRVRMVEYSPGYLADHWCDR